MEKWPKKFKSGGQTVAIKEVSRKELEEKAGGESAIGLFKSDPPIEILIAKEIPKESKDFTTAHEIIHAWLYSSGLQNLLDKRKEELFCDSLGNNLVEFLKNYKLK